MFSTIRNNYELYKKQYFRGDDIYCPFCSGFYSAEKYKLSKELSSICPVCGSTVEERTILLFLLTKTKRLSGELKIYLISEENILTDYFRKFPNSEVKVYSARTDFLMKDDVRGSDYETSSGDIIICNYILEKHPNPKILLNELKRMLKQNGILLLQANVDPLKEETAEYSHMYYKDRLLLYGIPGNLRRYGKDYPEIIRSFGFNMSRLMFTEGFEILPEMSFKKDEILYLAHKSDIPNLTDNTAELESEMDEQKYNDIGNRYSAALYTIFFILPELIKKMIFLIIFNIDEREENKGKTIYMVYVLMFGTVTFWGSLIIYKLIINTGSFLLWILVGIPLFIFFGGLGYLSMGGYFMTNDKAGLLKKTVVGLYLAITTLFSILFSFF